MSFKSWDREQISRQISKLVQEITSITDYVVDVLMGKVTFPFGEEKRRELVYSYVRVKADAEANHG
jgi:hypothetical protein